MAYLSRDSVKFIFLSILLFLLYTVIKKNNKGDQALIAASYVTGFEVFSRMCGGVGFSYEFAKYAVIGFLTLGMFYNGFHRKSWPYVFYIFLLMPGVLIAAMLVDFRTNFFNIIGFNLSGPICLGISALYCYDRKISPDKLNSILVACLLPIVAMTVYLYLFTPDIRDVLTGTQSNFELSGGFGPNQVATVLGFGVFILFARLFLYKNKVIQIIDLGLIGVLAYRAFVTFSRGGVITAGICATAFLFFYFKRVSAKERAQNFSKIAIIIGVCLATWFITSVFTDGLIDKRYANQDAAGRTKEDISTGRKELIATELEAFKKNPFLGIGAGRSKEYRFETGGKLVTTHNEISRILSEHGLMGILSILVLIITPLIFRIKDRSNLYTYSFLAFWFLTINHSSMRIAAPAFIYGLSVLSITKTNEAKKNNLIHR